MPIVVTGEHDNYIVQPRPLLDLNQLQTGASAMAAKVSGRDLALLDTSNLTYYVCTSSATNNYYFLAIAKSSLHNAMANDLVATLEKLRDYVAQHNCMYHSSGRILPKPEKLGFDHLFPIVVDNFICSEQANRRVLILDFSFTDLGRAVIASQLPEEDIRVDLRTSTWILARLIKLVGFLNFHNIMMPISLDAVVLERDCHRLMWLDWTALTSYDESLSNSQKCLGLKQAASAVLSLVGANYTNQGWNYDFFSQDSSLREGEQEYFKFLGRLYGGEYGDAVSAHRALNDVFCKTWPHGFYPFTAYTYQSNRTLIEKQELL